MIFCAKCGDRLPVGDAKDGREFGYDWLCPECWGACEDVVDWATETFCDDEDSDELAVPVGGVK